MEIRRERPESVADPMTYCSAGANTMLLGDLGVLRCIGWGAAEDARTRGFASRAFAQFPFFAAIGWRRSMPDSMRTFTYRDYS